jgi:hypothetical protein
MEEKKTRSAAITKAHEMELDRNALKWNAIANLTLAMRSKSTDAQQTEKTNVIVVLGNLIFLALICLWNLKHFVSPYFYHIDP